MENLILNNHPDQIYYPIISFNYQTGICDISGESYMEETYKFYDPIISWLKEFILENKTLEFNIKLTYFNTSSSRFISEILEILKKYKDKGGDVKVNWYYKNNDPDILNEINDFIEETEMDINALVF
jgi:hypothetical protein